MEILDIEVNDDPSGATTTICFRGPATVAEAPRIKDALTGALAARSRVLLDVTGVTRADLTLGQLLYAGLVEAAQRGKVLARSGGLSKPVEDMARLSGFWEQTAMKAFWAGEGADVKDHNDR